MERRLRVEIQALRAVAVGLVLVYHAFPGRLSGGYVGVDVFFCISGFLIGGQLLREAERTGRVSLGAFWARRARRILPAALLVLAVCTVVTLAAVRDTFWRPFLAEVQAAAAYVENWRLAADAVDYDALDNADSPVQHFWSLSIEEQFYLAWPLLILGAALLARRGATALVLGSVTAASFAYSLYATAENADTAYFSTFTRVWEFGVGGLLAMVAARPRSPVAAACLSWAGLTAIGVSAAAFSGATPFPGVAALLPVLGTAAVIAAGAPPVRWAPTALMRLRPVQWVGDASYSIYLWHFPVLIFAALLAERMLRAEEKLALLAAALVLGAVTKVLVEDPFRRMRPLTGRRPLVTFAAAGAATAAVLGLAYAGTETVDRRIRDDERLVERLFADPPRCFGAAARDPAQQPCGEPAVGAAVVPAPVARVVFPRRPPHGIRPRCVRRGALELCENALSPGDPARTIALIGDSHARHWAPALWAAARERGWRALSIVQPRCAFARGTPRVAAHQVATCTRWRDAARSWLEQHPDVRTVVVGQLRRFRVVPPPGGDAVEATVSAYADAWRSLPRSVTRIVVMADTPETKARGRTLACVDRAVDDGRDPGRDCAVPRPLAFAAPDAALTAAGRDASSRVRTVDLNRFLCDARTCPPVIGNALVYQDENHMTPVFSLTLGPYLGRALDPLVE